jgi:hypothetical protein
MNLVLLIQENPNFRRIYHILSWMVKIIPYYLVREYLLNESEVNVKPRLSPIEVIFLEASDMKIISKNPEVPDTEEELLKRLDEGCWCLGIKHKGEIAAYTWCNLRTCRFKRINTPLRDDEAYLLDARTFKANRGKNLAPYLRYQLYKHLAQRGRTKFYSITIMSNTSSMKFKEKLGGRPLKLYLYIGFCDKYHLNILLKTFIG